LFWAISVPTAAPDGIDVPRWSYDVQLRGTVTAEIVAILHDVMGLIP